MERGTRERVANHTTLYQSFNNPGAVVLNACASICDHMLTCISFMFTYIIIFYIFNDDVLAVSKSFYSCL